MHVPLVGSYICIQDAKLCSPSACLLGSSEGVYEPGAPFSSVEDGLPSALDARNSFSYIHTYITLSQLLYKIQYRIYIYVCMYVCMASSSIMDRYRALEDIWSSVLVSHDQQVVIQVADHQAARVAERDVYMCMYVCICIK